jgi:hypothetical protein
VPQGRAQRMAGSSWWATFMSIWKSDNPRGSPRKGRWVSMVMIGHPLGQARQGALGMGPLSTLLDESEGS